jgi:hypothetical protein
MRARISTVIDRHANLGTQIPADYVWNHVDV